MSGLQAMLAGDLRAVRHLLVPLAGLHVLRLGAQLGWFGTPAPDLATSSHGPPMLPLLVSFVTAVLTFVAGVTMALQSSPSRVDGFLATRPVNRGRRVLVGVLGLGLLLWLPFVLTDAIALMALGEAARVVCPAVADTALVRGVAVGAALAALWLGRSRREIWVGSVVVAAALGLSALVVWGWFEATRIGHEGAFFASAVVRPRSLAAVAVAGVLGWILLVTQWRCGWWTGRRRIGAVGGIVALSAFGLFAWPRNGSGPRREIALAGAEVRATLEPDGRQHLSVVVPTGTADGGEDRVVRVAAARVDGRVLPFWDPPVTTAWFGMGHTISPALARRIGGDLASEGLLLADVAEPGTHKVFYSRNLPDIGWRDGEERTVSLGLDGRAFVWRRVASLPVEPGAHDGGWTLAAEERAGDGGRRVLSLHLRSVRGFLEPGHAAGRQHHCFVLRRAAGDLAEVSSGGHEATRFPGGALDWRGYRVEFRSAGTAEEPPDGERLLVYRLVPAERLVARWEGRVTMERRGGPGQQLAHRRRERDPAELARWMQDEPPPSVVAGEMEVRSHLAAMLSRLNETDGHLPERHPAIGWMSALAARREDGVGWLLRARAALAMNDYTTRRAIDAALADGFRREDLPRLVGIEAVLEAAAARGWLGDVESELVAGAKEGRYEPLEQLLALPGRGGMGEGELFDLFLRVPRPGWYRLLGRDEAVRARMDRQIRAWWDSMPTSADSVGDPGFPMDLALAAGFPEAPERLHRLAAALGSTGWLDVQVSQYFERDGWYRPSGGRETEQFLALDPAGFEFDSGRGKYVWKGESR